jgi:hypothetical protein
MILVRTDHPYLRVRCHSWPVHQEHEEASASRAPLSGRDHPRGAAGGWGRLHHRGGTIGVCPHHPVPGNAVLEGSQTAGEATQSGQGSAARWTPIGEDLGLNVGEARMDANPVADVWTCDICLIKLWEAIRGELDCCMHHFCFVCIMAWSWIRAHCRRPRANQASPQNLAPTPKYLGFLGNLPLNSTDSVEVAEGSAGRKCGARHWGDGDCSLR